MSLLTANCITCERAIQEKDDVMSAFRIIDHFYVRTHPDIPIEQQAIPITFIGFLRLSADDEDEHTTALRFSGPKREPLITVLREKEVIAGKMPGLPRQAAILGQIGVLPHLGSYEIALLFDGEEVAKVQFTLGEPPDESSQKSSDVASSEKPQERIQ